MEADTLARRNVRVPPGPWKRVRALARARLRAQGWDLTGPLAPLLMHGALSALLCGLVREELSTFAYSVFALGLSAALVAVPLLGEFGGLLRADPTGDWIESQPVRRGELRTARAVACLAGVAILAAGTLVPAALLAPSGAGIAGRFGLVAGGLEQALCTAAVLLWIQGALGERAEGLLVFLQTLLVVFTVVGAILGLRYVPELLGVAALEPGPLLFVPPAWFATVAAPAGTAPALLALPHAAGAAALVLLVLAPAPKRPEARGRTISAVLLSPLRRLGGCLWVRPEERAGYELVFDALPLERDFVLRTYPMLGIPLAFLALGAFGDSAELEGRTSLLLFTTATYLPILLAHVPVTATPRARWILDSSPLHPVALHRGACKAVAVRFVVPLYVALSALTVYLGGWSLAARLALPAGGLALLLTRVLYPMVVADPPLSTEAEGLRGRMGGLGMLFTLAMGLTILSVVAVRVLATPAIGAVTALALVALLFASDRLLPQVGSPSK